MNPAIHLSSAGRLIFSTLLAPRFSERAIGTLRVSEVNPEIISTICEDIGLRPQDCADNMLGTFLLEAAQRLEVILCEDHPALVDRLAKSGEAILASLTPEKCHLWHMASCVPGEAGELFDAVKKYAIYEKPIDRANVVEELGDLEFYMQGVREALGITREETLVANQMKLRRRYAGGIYSNEAAQERADKA